MNILKYKKIIGILALIFVCIGGIFLAGNKLNLFPWTQTNIDKKIREKDYSDSFQKIVTEDSFSFPETKTVSFGKITDEPNQIGKYEERAKNKESIVVMEYEDENKEIKEAYVKSLELNKENIVYTLTHFTNYFLSQNLSQTEYVFKFSIDEFKPEKYKKETNSGTILISDNKIFIIMSNEQSIEPFVSLFKENNKINQTFLDYLKENPNVWTPAQNAIKDSEVKTQEIKEKISEDLKAFAREFWLAYISLNTVDLENYYSDKVWFYAGDEWFEEWDMDEKDYSKIHEFVDIEKEKLLQAYKNLKEEDFKEEFVGMQKLTNSIMLYPANDFMSLCYSENVESFYSDHKINSNDTIMVVRLDNGATCSVEGNFLAGELRFFVIRGSMGNYKITTDFTE
jgi:hypothetical protein